MRIAVFIGIVAFTLGCDRFTGTDHPPEEVRFPVGIAADSDGKHIYVVNSNFDLAFNGGTVVAIDVDTHKVVSGATVQTASFGGNLAAHSKDGVVTDLYLVAREGNTLTWIDVGRNGEAPTLGCRDESVPAGEAHECQGSHRVAFDGADISVGTDPFGVAIVPARDGRPATLLTTAFSGTMTVLELDEDGKPDLTRHVGVAGGAYGLAVHPLTGDAYVSSKSLNAVFTVGFENGPQPAPIDALGNPVTLDPEAEPKLEVDVRTSVVITNPVSGRDFGRGMAMNADGTLTFVAYRSPTSLLVIDTSLDVGGAPQNRLLDSVPLPDGPSAVVVAPTGKNGEELVYVTLFNSDEVAVIDPAGLQVIARIPTGNGPFDLVTVIRDDLKRAYVTLFESASVAVIELDASSPFYHQEIARIP